MYGHRECAWTWIGSSRFNIVLCSFHIHNTIHNYHTRRPQFAQSAVILLQLSGLASALRSRSIWNEYEYESHCATANAEERTPCSSYIPMNIPSIYSLFVCFCLYVQSASVCLQLFCVCLPSFDITFYNKFGRRTVQTYGVGFPHNQADIFMHTAIVSKLTLR